MPDPNTLIALVLLAPLVVTLLHPDSRAAIAALRPGAPRADE